MGEGVAAVAEKVTWNESKKREPGDRSTWTWFENMPDGREDSP